MLSKGKCRLFARLLALVMILSLPGFTAAASAVEELDPLGNWTTQYVDDPNLITNVTNPSNGVIRFKLTVPAGRTATYRVELIPNNRTGALDTVSGTYTNTGTTTTSKTVSVDVKYFSDQYTVSASYETGTQHEKYIHEDQEAITSRLVTAIRTNKFVWTEQNVEDYNRNQVITGTLLFASGLLIDILISKGVIVGGTYAMAAKVGYYGASAIDILGPLTQKYDDASVQYTPRAGWGFQVEYTPTSDGGYTRKLLVYEGDDAKTPIVLSTVPSYIISAAVR